MSILEFTPNGGPGGTAVTISGTGFSATATENQVTFNGVSAVVNTASGSQLLVTVSAGAATGVIAVTTPAGSGASASAFVVGATGGPTISDVSPPIVQSGATITISGTNFDTTPANNALTINATSAAVTSSTAGTILSNVPSAARSGRVRVVTRFGFATSAATLFIVPTTWLPTDVTSTGVIPFDTPTTVVIPPNKIAVMIFEGLANQRASVELLNNTSGCSYNAFLYDTQDDFWVRYAHSQGTPNPASVSTSASYLWDTRALPYTGSYQLVLDPCNTATSSITITVRNVLPDIVSPITPSGPPVVSNMTTIGQNARLTFTGTLGQRVSFQFTGASFGSCGAQAYLIRPDKPYWAPAER